jgi:sulfite reductase alpha subunit-like flavoprotein
LNPAPKIREYSSENIDEMSVLIGVSRPIQFQLPSSTTVPVAMFAGGSGIAPFRGFWQKRIQSGIGRNILFLGVQSREKLGESQHWAIFSSVADTMTCNSA